MQQQGLARLRSSRRGEAEGWRRMMSEVEDLKRQVLELTEILRKARPFVYRSRFKGLPHAQDKVDAEALWPRLEKALEKG